MGGVDAGVMERLAKVMGYMRVTAAGKPGKRLKKREKLAMLAGGGTLAVRPLNGAHDRLRAPHPPPQTALALTIDCLSAFTSCGSCAVVRAACQHDFG